MGKRADLVLLGALPDLQLDHTVVAGDVVYVPRSHPRAEPLRSRSPRWLCSDCPARSRSRQRCRPVSVDLCARPAPAAAFRGYRRCLTWHVAAAVVSPGLLQVLPGRRHVTTGAFGSFHVFFCILRLVLLVVFRYR